MDLVAKIVIALTLGIQLISRLRIGVDVIVAARIVVGKVGQGVQKHGGIRIDASGWYHILACRILREKSARRRIGNRIREETAALVRGWRDSCLGASYALPDALLADEKEK